MMKRLIMGCLVVCCMILVTAKGSAFDRRLGEDKDPNVILASEHYNMKIQYKQTELKHTDPHDYKNENLNEEPDDYLQGLIMAPIVIIRTIGENPVIMSKE
ncbi:MAG: hypothetical protein GY777_11815 [Candidatus Brocadiaceae bacterium]|nr:hypothetical protein [Candidatus Brocadiaceae bacterium]